MELQLPDRYHVIRLLGEGGMGRVYLARDAVFAQEVALKVLRPARNPAEREAQRFVFQAEVRSAASLTHPRIVPLYDAGELPDGAPYYTMRCVSGGSLHEFVKAPPPWPLLLPIIDQALEALAFAHARGVVHRDIKPHNVLLERRPQGGYDAFLSDLSLVRPFGSAPPKLSPGTRALRRTSAALSISGTPPYMAPEQYDEEGRDIGPWTDLYAVGVLIFELVTGRLPFEGDVLSLVFAKGTQRPPPLAPRAGYLIPSGLGEIVNALLAKHPGSRFELAADVRAALAALGPADQRGDGAHTPARPAPTLLHAAEDEDFASVAEALQGAEELAPGPAPALLPRTVPLDPPEDPGRGAPTRASRELYTYRRPALIGRGAETRRLWDAAREVLGGVPRIVLFEGESGVGKSRLARWLTESLESLGLMRVVRVRGKDRGALSGAISALIGGTGFEKQELRARLEAHLIGIGQPNPHEAAALARWLNPQTPEDVPPLAEQDALFARAVQRAARRGAACVWFDDTSPAEISAELLGLLARGARPVLALITPPPKEHTSPEANYLPPGGAALLTLRVPPLRPEECRALIQELLSLAPEMVEFAASRAEGNPLYAEQLVGHWIDTKLLAPHPGLPGLFRAAEGVSERQLLPPSTAELFKARLKAAIEAASDREGFVEALHIGALLGQSFGWRLYQEALDARAGTERAKALAWAVVASGLIQPTQSGRAARFAHAMLRDLLADEARQRHDAPALRRVLAQLVERRAADLEALLQAAEHWEGAGDGARAAQVYLRAAQLGARVDMTRTAWALRRARALVDGAGAPDLASRVEAELAHAARLEGDATASARHAANALALAQDKAASAAAHLALGYLARQSLDTERALLHFTRAEEDAASSQDKRALTRATLGLGDLAFTRGDLPGALALFIRAKELCPQTNDPFLRGRVLNRIGDTLRATGDVAGAAIHYGEARQTSAQRGDRITELIALSGLGDVALLTGDTDGALENFDEAMRIARAANYPEGMLVGALNLAAAHLEQREPARALDELREAERLLPKEGHWSRPLLYLTRAWAEAMRGETSSAEAALSSAQEAGLARYHDPDAARAAEGCGDEARPLSSSLAERAYQIAAAQYARLGRAEDATRVQQKQSA